MKRQLNLIVDIDSRKVTKYNDLIKVADTVDLQLTLLSKGKAIEIKQETVQLFLKKEDNKKVQQNVNINSNIISCTLDSQATTAVGKVIGEIIFTTTSNKVTSSSFLFEVEGSINHEILEESMDKVDILTDIQNSIVKANDTVEKYKNNIEPITGTSESIAALAAIKKISEESKNSLDTSVNLSRGAKKDLDESNIQAAKNLDALGKLGDATDLAKDVETVKKQVLENTYTKLETDSTLTKLESCKDSFVHNMLLRGKTLQNLWDNSKTITTVDSSLVQQRYSDFSSRFNTKGIYTIINTSNKTVDLDFSVENTTNYSRSTNISANSKKVITLSSDFPRYLKGSFADGWENTDSSKNEFSKSVMILEGEVKEIPNYFEGIKSVGELEDNKISILSHGKNLVDINSRRWFTSGVEAGVINNKQFYVKLKDEKKAYANSSSLIYLNANITYTLKYDAEIVEGESEFVRVAIKDMNEVTYTGDVKPNSKVRFKVPQNGFYKLYAYVSNLSPHLCKVIFKDLQVEEGEEATNYEPYKPDKTEILLPNEPLRGIGNVQDIIDFDKNELTRNVKLFELDGTLNTVDNIALVSEQERDNTLYFNIDFKSLNGEGTAIISNLFPNISLWNNDVEGIHGNDGVTFSIRILKSRLETKDKTGFIKWLGENKPIIVHKLATPVVEKLNIKDTLQTFKDGYIQLDNAITPTTHLEYSTNLTSIISRVVENQDKLIDRIGILEELVLTQTANKILENGGK